MGQKTHPVGFRLGVNKDWKSRWFFGKKFAEPLKEDVSIRKYFKTEFQDAWISGVEVERTSENIRVIIETARPGMVIGKGGEEVKKIRDKLSEMLGKDVYLDIKECKMPELDASLVAQNVARQIERRVLQRRAMKRVVEEAIKMGAAGIRVQCSGRLGGNEIARKEWYLEGSVPLHTISANIDYAQETANTKSGTIGVKVWINKDVL
jgi:small subunit ribosomal protein S3